MKSVECIGRTVDEAVDAALKQLGVNRERADIIILDEGSRGILGLGAKMARVRAKELVAAVSAPVSVAVNFLNRVANLMGLPDPTVEVKEDGDTLCISVDGENVGPMIGHHGDALDALQLLTGLVVNPQGRDSEKYFHVTLPRAPRGDAFAPGAAPCGKGRGDRPPAGIGTDEFLRAPHHPYGTFGLSGDRHIL
jgi:spoIIIJ-associated protein